MKLKNCDAAQPQYSGYPPSRSLRSLYTHEHTNFNVPIAVISLVDRNRQWFKSTAGIDVEETPRDVSFCGHAILGDDVFEVRNTRKDPRFRDNPMVLKQPHIRFYAGAPLKAPNGHKLGTLCLIDRVQHYLSDEEKTMLKSLADMIVDEMVSYVDTETGLDNRHALLKAGEKLFDLAPDNRRFSLVLFDTTDIVVAQENIDWPVPPEVIFAKLLRKYFPGAESIASLGREDFCVLLKEDDTFDVLKAIDQLRAEAKASIFPDTCFENFDTYVGTIQYDREKYPSIVAMLHQADDLFFQRDTQPSPETANRNRPGQSLDRWRKTIF